VLFSEPKILNRLRHRVARQQRQVSVLFSEPKILNRNRTIAVQQQIIQVSVLFSEPKILNDIKTVSAREWASVSVLFSEPKILNRTTGGLSSPSIASFSALQRAENSQSTREYVKYFTNWLRFSALQRAENSQCRTSSSDATRCQFQCSSASRKFSIDVL